MASKFSVLKLIKFRTRVRRYTRRNLPFLKRLFFLLLNIVLITIDLAYIYYFTFKISEYIYERIKLGPNKLATEKQFMFWLFVAICVLKAATSLFILPMTCRLTYKTFKELRKCQNGRRIKLLDTNKNKPNEQSVQSSIVEFNIV